MSLGTRNITSFRNIQCLHKYIQYYSVEYDWLSFQYMLIRTQDPDENVALEACEFWLAYAELPTEVLSMLSPYMGRSVINITLLSLIIILLLTIIIIQMLVILYLTQNIKFQI